MHNCISARRNDVFLRQRFDAIGHRLKNAVRANAIGPETVLDTSDTLAFENSCDGKQCRIEPDNAGNANDDSDRSLPALRQITNQPMLQQYKDLIEPFEHSNHSFGSPSFIFAGVSAAFFSSTVIGAGPSVPVPGTGFGAAGAIAMAGAFATSAALFAVGAAG